MPQMAAADSDGLFCQGEGYIACELRHFDSDGKHTLYILRPSNDDAAISVDRHLIPKAVGQVHGLVCEAEDSILISAFNTAIRFDLFDKTFKLDQVPVISTEQGRLDTKSYRYIPQVTILSDWGSDTYQYEFHQLHYMFPEKGNHNGLIENHSINHIVRINKRGQYVDGSHIILERMKIETID